MASTTDSRTDSLVALAGGDVAEKLIQGFVTSLDAEEKSSTLAATEDEVKVFKIGIAALDAFLQANVTGPVLSDDLVTATERRFMQTWKKGGLDDLRKACLKHLEVDGVSPYGYIPYLELFGLAFYIFTSALSQSKEIIEIPGVSTKCSLAWMKLRINAWHYKLLTQPSLGHGSTFARSSQWSEVPTLIACIIEGIETVNKQVIGDEVWAAEDKTWSKDDKVMFLLEAASNYILLGRNDLAKGMLNKATETSGLLYALSGALGKRTRFQENNISQLVVLAKSGDDTTSTKAADDEETVKPEALALNNDTLLEEISYSKEENSKETKAKELPSALAELSADEQPQLSPLDQIILLTEATLKDAFSPVDTLTSEEILPYAVRVLADKSTNWQIYTQALLVRSRIEVHRSRTVERGVLQLQAVADQVLTDTTASSPVLTEKTEESDVPAIQITTPKAKSTPIPKPTSFLPAPKPSESAPAHQRLHYIHALCTPPRWHLESELAYAWAGVGSLTSALEIFKRLRLWAEVALCLASAGAAEDEEGRGAGGEVKAEGIIRWRLFHRTGTTAPADADDEDVPDVTELRATHFSGPERIPPPPNAPRLWCILGDLEQKPSHYERAWEISNSRFARAQKSLGEYWLQQKDWHKALEAYKEATSANRLDPDMWSRLGDISLRLANFEDAAEAYSRAIGAASGEAGGEGARTWSNLGSALWSLYIEVTANETISKEVETPKKLEDEDDGLDLEPIIDRTPSKLLAQSLAAYKRGASISHDNWRIWDNVLTLSSRIRPTPVADIVLSLKQILRIRKTEDCIDADLLNALLSDTVLRKDKEDGKMLNGIYEPPRGSPERLVTRLLEEEIAPLITKRDDLWALVSKLRLWRSDHTGAIEASERAWRAATGSPSSLGDSSTLDYTSDKAAWENVVIRTDELASLLENYGELVEGIGKRWKGKVRSAVRSVMGKGKENWVDSEGWRTLEGIMEELKI